MRIAFIGQKGIPVIFGGVERHVEEISTRMASLGHEVFVYVRNNYTDKNLKEYKGVKLIHLPNIPTKHLDAISHTFLASIHALFQKYDVIHYQAIGPSSLSWIVKFFSPKSTVIATYHCKDYMHQKWGRLAKVYLRLSEKLACKVPDKTIASSKDLAQHAKKKYNVEAEVIANGANLLYNEKSDKLSRWGLKEKRYILYVGRFVKHKGIHYLIEAFKKLENTNKLSNNFKLVIVGEGFHTDDYVKYLKTISEGRNNIIFTGSQTGEDLDQLFSHAYLFVQPSEYEGLSLVLLEAMGYGLPILSSDIKENTEVIKDTGFIFKSKNVDDLKEKLAYILNKPLEAEEKGKLAKARIQKEYSWDTIVKRTIELYWKAIDKKKKLSYVEKNAE